MESNPVNVKLEIMGNLSAESTLLFSDIFNLYPGSFQKMISHLKDRYRIIIYEDHGFDIDEYRQELRHTSMTGFAHDLINRLEENNLGNITYIAHSVNAFLAFTAGVKAPHLFDKIILLSAMPCIQQSLVMQSLCGFEESETGHAMLAFTKVNLPVNKAEDEIKVAQLPHLLTDFCLRVKRETAQSVFNFLSVTDCRHLLSILEVPTLILQSGGDKVSTTEVGYSMHRNIPNSQLVKIRAKGHLPQMNAPEEIIQIMEFFAQAPVY